MVSFESDYNNGVQPEILHRLFDTNDEQTSGYGNDPYCEQAKEKIRHACQMGNAEIYFLIGGTQTNTTMIDALLLSGIRYSPCPRPTRNSRRSRWLTIWSVSLPIPAMSMRCSRE